MAQGVRSDQTGISIVAAPASGQRINPSARPVAAFLGRTTSGPVNQPVSIGSFAAFERMFADAPQGHGLAVALQQFFDHGGERAVVVRIENGARCGYLDLPTAGEPLRLESVNPGSAERVRASVDYHGIREDHTFNLTVQRMDAAARRILDQELYPGLSMDPGHGRYIGTALEHSQLVSLVSMPEAPMLRPSEMRPGISNTAIGYIGMSANGSDGIDLSDYDLIGSDRKATGLFALETIPQFDFLYAARDTESDGAGAAFIVAAESFCQRRNAMLVIDPPATCHDVAQLVQWRRQQQHAGHSSLTYFPALRHRETAATVQYASGALMGLLCRHDERAHVFAALADDTRQNSAALHRDWLPTVDVTSDQALQLLRLGVNPLVTGQQRRLLFPGLVTCANLGDRNGGSLTLQRMTKFILREIDFGTRWAVFAKREPQVWATAQKQVADFLEALAEAGAFERRGNDPGWWVKCDAATNDDSDKATAAFRLLIGFRPRMTGQPLMYVVSQHRDGSSVVRTALQGSEP